MTDARWKTFFDTMSRKGSRPEAPGQAHDLQFTQEGWPEKSHRAMSAIVTLPVFPRQKRNARWQARPR
jgi:hypothetical protein